MAFTLLAGCANGPFRLTRQVLEYRDVGQFSVEELPGGDGRSLRLKGAALHSALAIDGHEKSESATSVLREALRAQRKRARIEAARRQQVPAGANDRRLRLLHRQDATQFSLDVAARVLLLTDHEPTNSAPV